MRIVIEPHAALRAAERGVSRKEIEEVLLSGTPMSAKAGRIAKWKVFNFDSHRAERWYKQKRVEVVYTIEKEAMIAITVYAHYGEWRSSE